MTYKFCVYCGAAAVRVGKCSLMNSEIIIVTMHCNRCNTDYHMVGDDE